MDYLKKYGFEQKQEELDYLRQEVADRCARGIFDNTELLKKCGLLERQLGYKKKIEELQGDIEVLEELNPEDEELEELRQELDKVLAQLQTELLLDGKYDADDAVLTIHAGEGGTEACDWAEMLLRMYQMWAKKNGYNYELLDVLDGGVAGIKNVSIKIKGEYAYGMLQSEMGVHRLVRVSPFDSKGRRHTSFAAVEVMPDLSDAESEEIVINPEDIEAQTFRSGGAGGQYQNTTESGVRLIHKPTGLVAESREERSQHQNREICLRRLKGLLARREEEERLAEVKELKGEQLNNEWGSQIRSYVFMPYQLVRDERTGYNTGKIDAVMDGEIEEFMREYLLWKK